MKPIPAIVENDIARHGAAVDQALSHVREAEQHAEQADRRAQSAHEAVRARRLELGRVLAAARKAFPARGPNAKAWTDFLAVRRLTLEQAQDAMKYAGVVEELTGGFPDPPAKLPTRAEAGLDTPPRGDVPALVLVPDPAPITLTEEQLLEALDRLDPSARGRVQRSLRAKQARENEGDRDAYCTPPQITALLPEVDFDPCSNPRSTVRARRACQLERGENGLETAWSGAGFWNVPYSKPLPWAEKFDRERAAITSAGWLVNADHSPAWWHLLARTLPLRLDFDERLEFSPPPGVEASKNDRPQTLLMDEAFWAGCDQPALLAMGKLWRRDPKGGDASLDRPA